MKAALEEIEGSEPIERLDSSLKVILSRFMNITSTIQRAGEGVILETRSTCPVYAIYPAWCEEACLPMAEAMAKQVDPNFKVERIQRRPSAQECVFRFYLRP